MLENVLNYVVSAVPSPKIININSINSQRQDILRIKERIPED